MPKTPTSAPQAVTELVEHFQRNLEQFRSPQYKEAEARREFIDPFFEALGWDVQNKRKYAEAYKDVVHEPSLDQEDAPSRAPDYSFQPAGHIKFFVEAKKPSVNLDENHSPALQLRRYGWTQQLPISILTNFAEFAVYDCRMEPGPADGASTARVLYRTFDEYAEHWDELVGLFSPEAVFKGSFDRFAETRKRKGVAPFDQRFLDDMEAWRKRLAENLALRNHGLSQAELNYAVQQTIDRILFLRICEARGIEPPERLRGVAKLPDIYPNLVQHFRRADDEYNSGLFHFHSERGRLRPDELTLNLKLDDEVLRVVIDQLYWPARPYAFEVVPADILGQVYERFLGKVIRLTAGHHAKVEEKPEVKKAGGVYYTPTYIVDYIVKNTVGTLLENKTPKQASKFCILDPACGSGSFLLGAYDYLLKWYLHAYIAEGPEKHKDRLYPAGGGWKLTIREKKQILLDNIYGVDIDSQAVEVTKLSLLLKVLEGESEQTAKPRLIREPALPDLDRNIKCGNSLVGPDFGSVDEKTRDLINPFDWNSEFPELAKNGGFDCVIGNPPWVMAGYYRDHDLEYLRTRYKSAEKKFDLYYLFIEKGFDLLSADGLLGMIVPNKFFHTQAAASLRGLLSGARALRRIVDFGDEQVFPEATNYSCIILGGRRPSKTIAYARAKAGLEILQDFNAPSSIVSELPWHFEAGVVSKIFKKMEDAGIPLQQITARFGTGIQTGADRLMTFDESTVRSMHLEPERLRPILKGRDVRRYSVNDRPKLLIFPYSVKKGEFAVLEETGLRDYKRIYAHLQAHKGQLARRIWFGKNATELSGRWYGMMYLDSSSSFAAPHLLTPSLSDRSNFALGTGGLFATGTAGVTSIIPKPEVKEDIRYLLGVLNSSLVSFYAVRHSPPFSGGYYKFSAPYLRNLPIRPIDFSDPADKTRHDKMVALVERMLELNTKKQPGKLAPSELDRLDRDIAAADEQINNLVYQLYGLTQEEIALVESARETKNA